MRSQTHPARFATLLVAASLILGACGASSNDSTISASSDSSTISGDEEKEPIKIALIATLSGPLAHFGEDSNMGWEYAAEEANNNGGIDGHKVELIHLSSDATVQTTLNAARQAVSQDGAKFFGSVMTSPESAALGKLLPSLDALNISSMGQDSSLAGENCSIYHFNVVETIDMDMAAIASGMADLPGEKWASISEDFSSGHTAAAAIEKTVADLDRELVSTQFSPLGTTDFGPYITKIEESGADSVFAAQYGADGVAFVSQANQFGLADKLKDIVGLNLVDETVFEELGEDAVGIYNNLDWDANAANEMNKSFVNGFKEKFDVAPYYIHANSYLAAQTLFEGIKKAGSIKPADVAEALNDLTFDSLMGEVTMRGADHQLLRPIHFAQVENAENGPEFKIVSTVPKDEVLPEPDPACSI